jgi:putative hydrolase of the HAD superfamily
MQYDTVQAEGEAAGAQGRPVRDVIFDFGNVLLFWDPAAALVPRYDRATIERFLDNSVSGFYDANDLMDGGGSMDDAIAMMRAAHGDTWIGVMRYYLEHFEDSLTGTVPGARMLIHDLRDAGVGVWGLSNWQRDTFGIAQEVCGILHQLDDAVVSGFVEMRKPYRGIYELAVRRFGIDARTSVFIDDKAMNIIGANDAGLRGIRFSDPYRLRETLIGLGVGIPPVQSVQ